MTTRIPTDPVDYYEAKRWKLEEIVRKIKEMELEMPVDPPPMSATELLFRKEVLRVTNDIPEFDDIAQARGWGRVAAAAIRCSEEKLLGAIRKLKLGEYPRSDMVEEAEEAQEAAEKEARE